MPRSSPARQELAEKLANSKPLNSRQYLVRDNGNCVT
jgi:hypothetical protein